MIVGYLGMTPFIISLLADYRIPVIVRSRRIEAASRWQEFRYIHCRFSLSAAGDAHPFHGFFRTFDT